MRKSRTTVRRTLGMEKVVGTMWNRENLWSQVQRSCLSLLSLKQASRVSQS